MSSQDAWNVCVEQTTNKVGIPTELTHTTEICKLSSLLEILSKKKKQHSIKESP